MREPGDRIRRRPWADPALLAMASVTLVAFPWFWFPRSRSAVASSWLSQMGLAFLTAAFAVRLTRATEGSRHARRFWRTVVLAGVSCTIGDGYQTGGSS
jgi:hypothetical protein